MQNHSFGWKLSDVPMKSCQPLTFGRGASPWGERCSLTLKLGCPITHPLIDLSAVIDQLWCKSLGYWFTSIRAEQFTDVAHHGQQCQLAYQALIGFCESGHLDQFLPSGYCNILPNDGGSPVQYRKMMVADVQYVPDRTSACHLTGEQFDSIP